MEIENIDRLIANCLAEKATEEEYASLKSWIKYSKENYKYFHQIQNVWDSLSSENKISEFQTIAAYEKVERKISSKTRNIRFIQILRQIAAIAIIPLIVGAYLLGRTVQSNNELSDNETYNEVKAAYGTRSVMNLADGSQVWLNSGSILKYPLKFSKEKREVYLIGEAYFEVQSSKQKPFIVKTKNLDIKATGTKFNVQAYNSTTITEVALQEGKVDITKTSENSKSKQVTHMKPSEYFTYESATGKENLRKEDIYKYIAWKDGKLIFRNESLPNVIKKLCLLYNVEIELQGKQLQDQRYWGTFQDESLANILKFLKVSSSFDYKEIAAKPSKDGTYPKKKYIIFQTTK